MSYDKHSVIGGNLASIDGVDQGFRQCMLAHMRHVEAVDISPPYKAHHLNSNSLI